MAALLPEGTAVVLMGDRFYGSPELIALCRSLGWDYRLRLKANLVVIEGGGWTTTGDCAARGDHLLTAVGLTEKAIPTNIAIIQEPGHGVGVHLSPFVQSPAIVTLEIWRIPSNANSCNTGTGHELAEKAYLKDA